MKVHWLTARLRFDSGAVRKWRAVALAALVVTGCKVPADGLEELTEIPGFPLRDTVAIGGVETAGSAAFGSIAAAALLAKRGGVAIADGHTQQIHIFSLVGEHLKSVGGAGGGPGEFGRIHAMHAIPDGGLCVWDIQVARVTHLSASGAVVKTSRVDLSDHQSARPAFVGFFDDCGFVLRDEIPAMGMRDVAEGIRRDTVRYVLHHADGIPRRALLAVPNEERWFRNSGRSWGFVPLIFGAERVGFIRGEELWVGSSDEFKWRRIDQQGESIGEVGFAHTPTRATESQIASERARRFAEVGYWGGRQPSSPTDILQQVLEVERAGIREVPGRERVPAYDQVVVGAGGATWLREYPLPDESRTGWILMDSTLHRIGRAYVHRSDTIIAGSYEAVVSKSLDEVGVPVIRILQLERSPH